MQVSFPHAGVYVVDDHGCIVAVNARAETMLQRTQQELAGLDQQELIRGKDGGTVPAAQSSLMHALLSGRPAQGALTWFERGDGTVIAVTWTTLPCAWGQDQAGMIVIFNEAAPQADGAAAEPLSELERLALLAETTSTLTSTLNEAECVERLIDLVVPRLADWAIIDLANDQGEVWRTAVAHHQAGRLARRADLEGPMPAVSPDSQMPLSRALRGVAASLADFTVYQGEADSGIAVIQQELFAAAGIHSAAIAPIRGPREVLGAMTLGRTAPGPVFTTSELTLLEDITRRAGLALSNSRLYQRQRHIAETMQRHLLPQLPQVPGLHMAARYLPAPDASQVGGDWYDAFPLSDGATALAIGDVVGHDIDAAAGMAQVRNMLRALAWSHQEHPAAVVNRLDQALHRISSVTMATLVLARLHQDPEQGWTLRWSNAGHPPPLLVTQDGRSHYLESGRVLLLGTGSPFHHRDTTRTLPAGATLLFYTDGLIESHANGLDAGMARLRRHAAALATRTVESFCDLLLERVRPNDNDDDVALLAVRIP